MLQIRRLDSCDPLAIVDDFGPRLDEGVKDDVAVEVDDRNAGQPVPFLRQDPLAVECQNFRLPKTKFAIRLKFKRYLLSALQALIEHIIEEYGLLAVRCKDVEALSHVLLLEWSHWMQRVCRHKWGRIPFRRRYDCIISLGFLSLCLFFNLEVDLLNFAFFIRRAVLLDWDFLHRCQLFRLLQISIAILLQQSSMWLILLIWMEQRTGGVKLFALHNTIRVRLEGDHLRIDWHMLALHSLHQGL